MEFSEYLKSFRKQYGLSQARLAEITGLSLRVLWSWEGEPAKFTNGGLLDCKQEGCRAKMERWAKANGKKVEKRDGRRAKAA